MTSADLGLPAALDAEFLRFSSKCPGARAISFIPSVGRGAQNETFFVLIAVDYSAAIINRDTNGV